jgi:hypothetical protein
MPAFLLPNQTDAVGINGKRQVGFQTRWDEFCMAESATTINENGV